MTDTGLSMGAIILGLALLSVLDYLIVAGCVWAAARIFRYKRKDRGPPSKVVLYSLKVGLAVAVPFLIALYLAHPSVDEILSKGPRLLLPLGLVVIVKTAAFFHEMKKAYGEGMKKTVNGYATAVYLIIVAWIIFIAIASMLVGFYGLLSMAVGDYGEEDATSLTGWWDLQPEDSWTYNASARTFSVLFRNDVGEPIKIDAGEAVDVVLESDCNVSSPLQSELVATNGSFSFNATCEGPVLESGVFYGILVEIHYTTLNNPIAPLFENGYFSGNASA
jgi:hypothetical protein